MSEENVKPVETDLQRAQRIAREVKVRRDKKLDEVKKETLKKVAALSKDFTPVFLPFKDRDGKIVPCVVVGESFANKVDAEGNLVTDPETKELVPEYQLQVFVFGGANTPRQVKYPLDEV